MAERKYASKEPGVRFSHPDVADDIKKEFNGKNLLTFNASNGSIVTVVSEKIQKAIEASKDFAAGKIFRIPTDAEKAAAEKERQQEAYRAHLVDVYRSGFFSLEGKNNDELVELCDKAGIDYLNAKNEPLSGGSLQKRIVGVLNKSGKQFEN
jgi:hypothetical protein